MMFGASTWGKICDLYGRKTVKNLKILETSKSS